MGLSASGFAACTRPPPPSPSWVRSPQQKQSEPKALELRLADGDGGYSFLRLLGGLGDKKLYLRVDCNTTEFVRVNCLLHSTEGPSHYLYTYWALNLIKVHERDLAKVREMCKQAGVEWKEYSAIAKYRSKNAFVDRMVFHENRHEIDDNDIFHFLHEGGFPRMMPLEFDLRGSKVTEAGLEALAKNCSSMQEMWLCCCERGGSDAGIKALATHCGSLKMIGLSNCDKVTDAGIEALAKNCKSLTSIGLAYCENITDVGIDALATNCKSLTLIKVTGSNNVTARMQQKLKAHGINK